MNNEQLQSAIRDLQFQLSELQTQLVFLKGSIVQSTFIDKVVFNKKILPLSGMYFPDRKNISGSSVVSTIEVGTGSGLKIGTATTQKLGFFNATPVVQQAAIAAPSGGATQDAEARTAINQIRTTLQNYGFNA